MVSFKKCFRKSSSAFIFFSILIFLFFCNCKGSYNKNNDNIGEKDEHGQIPLHRASANGQTDKVKLLIEKGSELNTGDNEGRTPLFHASLYGHTDTIALLVEKGADVNIKSNSGFTPLHAAVYWGHPEAAKLLVIKGADVNARDVEGKTPLKLAVEKDDKSIQELLRQYGAVE